MNHYPPKVARNFVSVAEVLRALGGALDHPGHGTIQGTVARSGEVLLLTFDAREEGWEVPDHDVQLKEAKGASLKRRPLALAVKYRESQRWYQGRGGSWYCLRARHVPMPTTPVIPRRRMTAG